MKLYGKEDFFNYEMSQHQIGTELLCSERLFFQCEFSSDKSDLTMKIIKNGNQETKLSQTSMVFTSGQYKQTEGTNASQMKKMSTMNTTIDSQKGKKEVLIKNDL